MYTNEKIDIKFLLNHIHEERLMEYYLGIPVQFSQLVTNPLRRDKKPTCGFHYYNHRLYFKDFAGYNYDFLNVVQIKYSLGYNDACRKVMKDFIGRHDLPKQIKQKQVENKKTELRIKSRSWEQRDVDYWWKFGINVDTLNKFRVKPISGYWLNDNYFPVSIEERGYAYILGDFQYKLYFVDRPKGSWRFIQNASASIVMGMDQLPENGDVLLINKAYKDTMCWNGFDIPGINGLNENQIIASDIIRDLRRRFKKIYSLYDFDYTGITTANKHKKLYGVEPLFYRPTIYTFYKKDIWEHLPVTAKDTADTRALNKGKQTILNLIHFVRNHETFIKTLQNKDVPY